MQAGGYDDDPARRDEPSPDSLPRELPIFPLTGVLLLPGARLPLNVFEPRYLNMVEDALGHGRMIGLVQPVAASEESPEGEPPVYEIGCAGRIASFAETGDGRFVITLLGVCRFQIDDELSLHRGYRRVRAEYAPFADDVLGEDTGVPGRDALLATTGEFFRAREIEADWNSLTSADDTALVTTLAMVCPFEPREKQALLECAGTAERAEMLIGLMNLAMRGGGNAPVAH